MTMPDVTLSGVEGQPQSRLKHFAVVGQPIAHSRSPEIFAALSRAAEIPLTYERIELTPEQFDRAFADARERFDGWNVTAPHKHRALAAADDASADARTVGAANVITFRDGRAHAANTDVGGVKELLRSRGIDPAGQVVTLLGAGGAARSAVVALAQLGAKRIVIANRTLGRARELIADLQSAAGTTELLAGNPAAAPLVINATSNGAAVSGAVLACTRNGWCVDLQYKPTDTPFVQAARAAGHNAVNGTHMLVAQAVATFRLWYGEGVQFARDAEAALTALVEAP
ncbi:MAG: shikimate dehydrogenase [Candidatus Lustribacter sp.]